MPPSAQQFLVFACLHCTALHGLVPRTHRSPPNCTLSGCCRTAVAAKPQGKCLYYREWNRPQNTLENAEDAGEEQRLMFGMLYSLKVSRIGSPDSGGDAGKTGRPPLS